MAITIVALWRFLHLGRRMCAYTLFGLHCEVTRVLKLRTVSDDSANSESPSKGLSTQSKRVLKLHRQ